MSTFSDFLAEKKLLVSDGATGSNLIQRGLPQGKTGEDWVLHNPSGISALHQDFVTAGSDIILTCTFGASRPRLEAAGLVDQFEDVNRTAVSLAREVAQGNGALVAASLGPLGQMLAPLGPLGEKEAEEHYREQAALLDEAGADLLVIETQFDLIEANAAVRGVQAVSQLPLIVSFSFDRGTRSMMGVNPAKFAQSMQDKGLAALGINCGKSLEDNLNALKELVGVTDLPIWFKPNAGLPALNAQGLPVYDVSPQEMAAHVGNWLEAGARIIGGCCGTSPDHLRAIAHQVELLR